MHKRPLPSKLRFIEDPAKPSGELGDPAAGGGAGDKPAEKTFTQAELSAVAAREKSEGKAAAERAIAEQLGVSIDEAKAIIKTAKDADDAKKSEADKDRDAAAKEKQEAEAERQSAKVEVHEARLERAFAKEGIDLEDSENAETKRLLRLVTVEPGAKYEEVLADVQAIKAAFPALFGTTAEPDPTKRKAPGGDPKGTPPKPNAGEDKFAKGAERAKARYATPTFDPLAKK